MSEANLSKIALLMILLLAAFLRLTRLDLAEFKRDEATVVRRALAIVHEGQFPVVGVASSQGPDNPPLALYLMALPFAFSQDPRLAVGLVATLNLAAVLATYLLVRRFFDTRVALIATWLFAVNPWAVLFARKIWAQNLPLVTLGFMTSLFFLVVARRPWALFGAFLGLAALIGLHLGGLVFVFVLALALLCFPSRIRRRPLVLGLLALLVLSLPYLCHDALNGWPNLQAFLELGSKPAQVSADAPRYAAWISSGYRYQDLAGVNHQAFLNSLVNLGGLDVVEMVLLGCGVIYLLFKVVRLAAQGRQSWREKAPRYVLPLAWLLVPVALQTRHTEPVYPHYFILLYPVQHLIIAILLVEALDWGRARLERRGQRRYGRAVAVGLALFLAVLGGWQVYLGQAFHNFVARYDTPGGYGPLLGPSRRAASAASDAAAPWHPCRGPAGPGCPPGQVDGAEILVVARGDNPAWADMPAVFEALLPRHLPRRFVDGEQALVFPLGPAVYITTPEVEAAAATLQGQTEAMLLKGIKAPGEGSYRVFRRSNVSRDDVLAGMTPLDPPRRLANGVELLAYRVDGELQPGETVGFTLAWWLDGPPPGEADYHTFAHLVDAPSPGGGRRWGQHDLTGFPTTSWRAGDLVLTRFQIQTSAEAPPGEYWVNLGMYSYPDIIAVPVIDAAGNPVADLVTVGPVVLR